MNASLPRVLALLSCLLAPAASLAVEVTGLFEASVPVANQGAGERQRATQEGFRQVLVKASGQRSVLAVPAVQPELGKAESLLGSYRYETLRHDAAVAPARAPGNEAGQASTRLRLKFDAGSVLGVLNRAAAPVWSASRPQVFLWVSREGPAAQLFALGTSQADVLLDAAARRGIPVAIPAPGDLAAPAPAAAGVPEAILSMASRVGAQVVLYAGVVPAAGRTRAVGVLRVEGAEGVEQRLEVSATGEEDAIKELIDQAADFLGARLAVIARQDQVSAVRLRVEGVGSLADWAALERWLASQPLVKDAVVSRVDLTGTEFTLLLAGEPARLLQAMRADGRFAAVGEPVADGAAVRIQATLASTSAP